MDTFYYKDFAPMGLLE